MPDVKSNASASAGGGGILLATGLVLRFATTGDLHVAGAVIDTRTAGDLIILVAAAFWFILAGITALGALVYAVAWSIDKLQTRRARKRYAAARRGR